MASRHRSNSTSSYRTYGSVAYAPAYDGSAIRAPGRESTLQPRPKARPRTREQALTRTKVQVREAGEVSPFAVIGFAAGAAMAVKEKLDEHAAREEQKKQQHEQTMGGL